MSNGSLYTYSITGWADAEACVFAPPDAESEVNEAACHDNPAALMVFAASYQPLVTSGIELSGCYDEWVLANCSEGGSVGELLRSACALACGECAQQAYSKQEALNARHLFAFASAHGSAIPFLPTGVLSSRF
eukprot:SAG11_NODE_5652_length_1496_cov_1.239084_2_plen_132_part_01